jgi:hypothetical protein
MNKYIITFGSAHLPDFQVNATYVALIIEAEDENAAREVVFAVPGIGARFAFSYPYSKMPEFAEKYNMVEMTLNELERLRFINTTDQGRS